MVSFTVLVVTKTRGRAKSLRLGLRHLLPTAPLQRAYCARRPHARRAPPAGSRARASRAGFDSVAECLTFIRIIPYAKKEAGEPADHPLGSDRIKNFRSSRHRVMLDRDLAELYGVETRALNQAVKRNRDRFPEDFMFELTLAEGKAVAALRSQNMILKRGAHLKYAPRVFTEHGAVMLANVLKSAAAVHASIQVVRAFVHLRQLIATNDELVRKIEALERKVGKHDAELQAILTMLRKMLQAPPKPEPPKAPMGFMPSKK